MQPRKNFISRNEGFTCEACGANVPPASGTCRNHCPQCLTGKHVDAAIPGDRQGACGGWMATIAVEGSDPDRLTLIQRCARCSATTRNRAAPDDNKTRLFSLMHPLPLRQSGGRHP